MTVALFAIAFVLRVISRGKPSERYETGGLYRTGSPPERALAAKPLVGPPRYDAHMIKRGLRLTGLRRSILASLPLDHGEAIDTLKRRVALERAVAPDSPRWNVFNVSFSRALRLLERAGVLEVRRDFELFRRACASWVQLTPLGKRERARTGSPNDQALGPIWGSRRNQLNDRASFAEIVARSTNLELLELESAITAERGRRMSQGLDAEGLPRTSTPR
jgi:hypothetical protein